MGSRPGVPARPSVQPPPWLQAGGVLLAAGTLLLRPKVKGLGLSLWKQDRGGWCSRNPGAGQVQHQDLVSLLPSPDLGT